MAQTAKKAENTSAKQPTMKDLADRLDSLEERVETLEERRVPLPSAPDFSETQNRLVTWTKENPLIALGIAAVVGLIIGLLIT